MQEKNRYQCISSLFFLVTDIGRYIERKKTNLNIKENQDNINIQIIFLCDIIIILWYKVYKFNLKIIIFLAKSLSGTWKEI